MNPVEQRILQQVDANRDKLIDLTQQLVRIPSVVGTEGTVQEHVAHRLRQAGLDVSVFEPDKAELRTHPDYVEVPWEYVGRPNVVGTLAGAPDGRSLILNAHVDVVSPEPVERWQYDPWGAAIAGNRLYGRGAWDMKSGLAASIVALESVLQAGLRPAGTVMVQSVIEEEAGGGGTLSCLMRGYRADAFYNPEPFQQIIVGMTGVLYFRVRVTGKTIHAGTAHLGVNAIGKLNRVYDALVALDQERAASRHHPLFEGGWSGERSCHLNVGTYRAGDWPSTVAGFAEIECRISFIPGETEAEVRSQVEGAVAAAATGDPWLQEHPPVVQWFGWHTDPWLQETTDPFVQCFKGAAQAAVGRDLFFGGATAGLDTRFAGRFGIPSLCFGARGANMHGIDEYVEIDSIIETARTAALTIARWCGLQS